jgi:hypothetical protein
MRGRFCSAASGLSITWPNKGKLMRPWTCMIRSVPEPARLVYCQRRLIPLPGLSWEIIPKPSATSASFPAASIWREYSSADKIGLSNCSLSLGTTRRKRRRLSLSLPSSAPVILRACRLSPPNGQQQRHEGLWASFGPRIKRLYVLSLGARRFDAASRARRLSPLTLGFLRTFRQCCLISQFAS